MKKYLAIILALVMAFVVITPAAAETVGEGTTSKDVLVAFVDQAGNPITPATVYSVDITFNSLLDAPLKWTTTVEGSYKWNPATHLYENQTTNTPISFEAPDPVADAVVVKNHSNADVSVTAGFNGGTEAQAVHQASGIGVKLGTAEEDVLSSTLENAAEIALNNPDGADSVSYTLTPISSTLLSPAETQFTIGTITVIISAVQ